MNIVIDTNILFSALIKNSKTRKIILEYDGFFLFPQIIFEETKKYKAELLSKSGMDEKDFNKLLFLLLKKVVVVTDKDLNPYRKEAFELIKDIDLKDVLFVACTLAYPNSIFWSNDKKLKRIREINVLNTEEIVRTLSHTPLDNLA